MNASHSMNYKKKATHISSNKLKTITATVIYDMVLYSRVWSRTSTIPDIIVDVPVNIT